MFGNSIKRLSVCLQCSFFFVTTFNWGDRIHFSTIFAGFVACAKAVSACDCQSIASTSPPENVKDCTQALNQLIGFPSMTVRRKCLRNRRANAAILSAPEYTEGSAHRNIYLNICLQNKGCIKYFGFLQFGSSRHAGECVQRLGDHHHLSSQQQAAGGGGSLYQADGQHGGLHDLHLCRCIHV